MKCRHVFDVVKCESERGACKFVFQESKDSFGLELDEEDMKYILTLSESEIAPMP